MVRFGVLGPLTVSRDGVAVPIGAPLLRTILAVLLCRAGRTVSGAELVDVLWEGFPPRSARKTTQVYVHRLRQLVGPELPLHSDHAGYRLQVETAELDALRFAELAEQGTIARRQGEHARAADLLRQALGLWRGEPYADVLAGELIAAEVRRLVEQRLLALEERLVADLDQGRHAEVTAELQQLTLAHPYRERLPALHMLALYRAGRQADALAVFRDSRARLADQLGIEPGGLLQRLHTAILRGDEWLARAPIDQLEQPATTAREGSREHPAEVGRAEVRRKPTTARDPTPETLPLDAVAFVGRIDELRHLDNLLVGSAGQPPETPIATITGPAGVGKTALAIRWGHRARKHFPDGRLYVDLRGYSAEPMLRPIDALARLLHALGVPGSQIPLEQETACDLFRNLVSRRRMLIVLDNAHSAEQVRPLLPGGPHCAAVVTSRRGLAGLTAYEGARPITLEGLSAGEARSLLERMLGAGAVRNEPEAAGELARLCGHLPLAIRIAAARLRSHPTWNLSYLVRRLHDQRHRLSELEAEQHSVTAALDLSYQHLGPDQQQTYRLLGQHRGPDIDAYATAALLGSTVLHAARILDHLLDANLMLEPVAGRYRFHDLTRAHAIACGQTEPAEHPAWDRLLDYYRHTASVAMNIAYPHEREQRPHVPPAGTPIPDLSDPAQPLEWLDSELPNLLAAAGYAVEHDRPAHILHLSTILHRHLRTRGLYHDAETLHGNALAAARASGDQVGELTTLISLGHVHRRLGRHDQASDHYQRALQLARATSHRAGELDALSGLAWIHRRQGRYAQVVDHLARALQLARATGHRVGELNALAGLGDAHTHQGRYVQAIDHYELALESARATGHSVGELNALTGLAWVHLRQGQYQRAAEHYQQILRIARAAGNRPVELNALTGLAQLRRRQGRHAQATESYRQLLDLAQQSGDRNFEFEAWQGLGRLEHRAGRPDSAITHHDRALAFAAELGQPADQARAHDGLAHAHRTLNQPERARRHWQYALDILADLGVDHTEDEETTVAAIRDHLAGRTAVVTAESGVS